MKWMIFIAVVIAVTAVPAASQQDKMEKGCGHFKTTSIDVPTAKCEMCSDKITDALKGVRGVHSVDVDLEKKIATVEYCTMCTSVAKMEKAISDAGYSANKMERDQKAYEQLPSCCQ